MPVLAQLLKTVLVHRQVHQKFQLGHHLHKKLQVFACTGVLLCAVLAAAQPLSETDSGDWAFINGTPAPGSAWTTQYGSLGIPSPVNHPGYRGWSSKWSDSSGNIYLFGGSGIGETSSGFLNDFWHFDATLKQWEWIGGSKQTNTRGNYGTQGVSAATNFPGARFGAACWTDTSGTLWLFGGLGYDDDQNSSRAAVLNDLWKYDLDIKQWTWVQGSSDPGAASAFATVKSENSTNNPSARYGSVAWSDANGYLWLFGGITDTPLFQNMNDLWRFNPATGNWACMRTRYGNNSAVYGNKGNESPVNVPAGRNRPSTWVDATGKLYMYGGTNEVGPSDTYSDLWRFNTATNNWAWLSGSTATNIPPIWGTAGLASPNSTPGSRSQTASWTDATGNLWLLGGNTYYAGTQTPFNDLWVYSLSSGNWTWMNGSTQRDSPGVYGALGQASPTFSPGSRFAATAWVSTTGTLCLRGGMGNSSAGYGILQDSWSYDVTNNAWTWLGGGALPYDFAMGTYGTQGVAASVNQPPACSGAASWTDSSGDLWLFSGQVSIQQSDTRKDDLWKYTPSTGLWTWIDGQQTTGSGEVHGQLGIADPANTPGSRAAASTWIDAQSNLWLFGGSSDYTPVPNGTWKYDTSVNNWACIIQASPSGLGVYGTRGTSATGNMPGGRSGACTWTLPDGTFWLFGGYGKDSAASGKHLDDLWEFDPTTTQWTWISGNPTGNSAGVFGTKGLGSEANLPPARSSSVSWYSGGKLWLYGGETVLPGGLSRTSDLWSFDPETKQWTWVSGSNQPNPSAVYGQLGVEAPSNSPGSLINAAGWPDDSGNLWLFGGDASTGVINTLWKFDTLSGNWTWVKGRDNAWAGSIIGTPGSNALANTPGSRYSTSIWATQNSTIWLFGGTGSGLIGGSRDDLNDLWRFTPSRPTAAVDWNEARLYQ